ncbi:MAG: hypothetical protein ACOYI8_03560 [Christensenellales bacterium]|jgi:hypothetical protein
METYSAAHEKEERRFMRSGFVRSLLGILLCWLPLVGQMLSISGYLRQAVRLTRKHRVRLAFATIFAVLSVVVSIGALCTELYVYAKRPDIVEQVKTEAQKLLFAGAPEGGEYGEEGEEYLEEDDEYSTDDENWVQDENGEWHYVGEDEDEVNDGWELNEKGEWVYTGEDEQGTEDDGWVLNDKGEWEYVGGVSTGTDDNDSSVPMPDAVG